MQFKMGYVLVWIGLLHVCVAADQLPAVDLFGTGTSDWHLVFRGTPYIQASVYDAYLHGSENVDPGCKQTADSSLSCFQHYRSSILDNWRDIDEVAFVVLKSGTVQKYAIFDGHGSDNTDWFSPSRLKSSNWTDLKSQPKHQFFSIVGDEKDKRRFFINHNYEGCTNDAGWFVAVDHPSPSCPWEKEEGYPIFKYADSDSFENWTKGKVAQADAIAVYVKYRKVEKLDFVDIFESGKPEYRLVFRGTSHNNQSVYDAYLHGSENVDAACKQTNGDIPCTSHYRSSILDYWRDIDEVVFAIYNHGKMEKYVTFDGTGTNNLDWFSETKMRAGSWSDIKGQVQFFTIPGAGSDSRRFFINHQYGGCPADAGWFVAVDKHSHPCGWETVKTYPLFLYSTSSHFENWNSANVMEADVIAVFVKFGVQGSVVG